MTPAPDDEEARLPHGGKDIALKPLLVNEDGASRSHASDQLGSSSLNERDNVQDSAAPSRRRIPPALIVVCWISLSTAVILYKSVSERAATTRPGDPHELTRACR